MNVPHLHQAHVHGICLLNEAIPPIATSPGQISYLDCLKCIVIMCMLSSTEPLELISERCHVSRGDIHKQGMPSTGGCIRACDDLA